MKLGTIIVRPQEEGMLLEFKEYPEVYICWPESWDVNGNVVSTTPWFERVNLISVETHNLGDITCGDYAVKYSSNGKEFELHLGAFQCTPNGQHLDEAIKEWFAL